MTNDGTKRTPKASTRKSDRKHPPTPMSEVELARLGGGQVAYIKIMSSAEAKAMFPAVQGLPQGINLYSVHAADGTPLALTDSMSAAISHAMGDELEIATLH